MVQHVSKKLKLKYVSVVFFSSDTLDKYEGHFTELECIFKEFGVGLKFPLMVSLGRLCGD